MPDFPIGRTASTAASRGTCSVPAVALALVVALVLAGCSKLPSPLPQPSPTAAQETPYQGPVADTTVTALVQGLVAGNLDKVPFIGDAASATQARTDYTTIMSGMDGLTPSITSTPVRYLPNGVAEVDLAQTFTFESQKWQFTTTAKLNLSGDRWFVDWDPTIVHPDLDERNRLRHTRTVPVRAAIVGAGNQALMEERELFRVGIDKQNATPAQWDSSARALARLVNADPAAFAKRVKAAGAKAFVAVVTLRQTDIPAGMTSIPGASVVAAKGVVAPNPTFARSILGVVGEATPEQIAASKGLLQVGDLVGQSGLQKRYDKQLRGSVGHVIALVPRRDLPSPAPSDNPDVESTLFEQKEVAGKPLQVSLDLDKQMKAEEVLAKVGPIASIVVVKPSTGEIVAAANSPAAGENPDATFGRYAPGSTFKVVTALALLRKGYSAGTTVNCSPTVTVNGRVFKNYSDFPASRVGTMSLQDALALSCNTALIREYAKLGPNDLAQAAASLGIGQDYDAGYASFFGSVPVAPNLTTKAANMIGQGQVEASPMAMAGLAATVASGRTTIPWLVASSKPTSKAAPLTAGEAAQLSQMMRAVVSRGTAQGLAGTMVGAKSGTAEYGTANPPKTHAWMIAFSSHDLAIAVMVADGESGSKSAMPLIKAYLAP
ncbi:penicillin-binding transpeptidase domain-containing protein [Aestuariimicrobium soli]|uniref:penicillin-binding transpeptidase domain-containing protein n=1 Tax=Aestuariimicrobium soli TaxID=2035834 RepID=UPI003EB9343D